MPADKSTQSLHLWRLRPRERRALLIIIDILMGIIATLIALLFWADADTTMEFSLEFLSKTPIWFYLLPLLWPFLLAGTYEEHHARSLERTLRAITLAAIIGMFFYSLIYFTSEPASLPRLGVLIFVLVVSILELTWRFIYINIFTAPRFMRRILIVGAGETGKIILKIANQQTTRPFIVAGVIDDDPLKIGSILEGHAILCGSDKLLETILQHHITDLIVAISGQLQGSMFQALLDAQEMGVDIIRMPVVYEELLHRVPIRYLEADWILRSFVDEARVNAFFELAKRGLDIIGGLVGVILLLLMMPFVALAILIDSGKPIFYTQVRMGKGAQPYFIFKFRTMNQNAEPDGTPQWAEENDTRATRVGRILRKTHLDEFPQFINVLRGEMSLVGPRAERPELVQWFQQHVPFYRARLLVKPGITGWAQVNQEYAATIDETIEKLEFDLYYIKHRNILLDLRVMMMTPSMILGLRGR